ncbi:MAG: F0F1 ATP synthase subunit epsilon [Campylobacterales bacterium]
MTTFKMEIVTPSGKVYDKEVKYASIPGKQGEFGVLPGHSALVTLLSPGVIEIEEVDGNKEGVAINWGYVEVNENKVTVLADRAVAVYGKTDSDLAKALDEAEKLLESAIDSNVALASAKARIQQYGR